MLTIVNAGPDSASKTAMRTALEAVRVSVRRENLLAAINQLIAFQRLVDAQVEPVDAKLAAQLTAMAEQTIQAVDPSGVRRAVLASMAGRPMRLQRILRVSGNAMFVEGSAAPGSPCSMQRSANLYDWVEAGVLVEVSDGVFHFIDLQLDGLTRF